MTNFFTYTDMALVTPSGFRVVQAAPPPASNAALPAYKYFPLNSAVTQNIAGSLSSTWTGGSIAYFLWANRVNNGHNKKPNRTNPVVTTGGTETWLDYSTKARGDAATRARLAFALGYAANEGDGVSGYNDICTAAGLTCVTWSAFNASPSTYGLSTRTVGGTTYQVVTDVCVLPADRLCDCVNADQEVYVDWEVQDGHTTTETLATLTALKAACATKGVRFSLYTNPWDAGEVTYNGFKTGTTWISDAVLALCDSVSLLTWLDNPTGTMLQSLQAQVALFTSPDYSKFYVLYALKGSTAYPTLTDAQAIRTEMLAHPYGGIYLFPNGATMGDGCSTNSVVINQIAALTGLTGC